MAELEIDGKVEYHIHKNEFERYYIILGNGIYNDSGEEIHVYPGIITFTPSGSAHGIKM